MKFTKCTEGTYTASKKVGIRRPVNVKDIYTIVFFFFRFSMYCPSTQFREYALSGFCQPIRHRISPDQPRFRTPFSNLIGIPCSAQRLRYF